MRTAENGHIKIIELLAQIQYADLDTETRGLGYTALHLELNNGHIAAAKILVHRGVSVRAKDYKQSTILFHALRYAVYGPNATVREEMFALYWELLPQVSKDLYWRDNSGDSPLKLGLTSSRSLEFAQMLLGRHHTSCCLRDSDTLPLLYQFHLSRIQRLQISSGDVTLRGQSRLVSKVFMEKLRMFWQR
jgi:hypothetical protein